MYVIKKKKIRINKTSGILPPNLFYNLSFANCSNQCCGSHPGPDSMVSLDPSLEKKEKVNKFYFLDYWMFSFDG
jgi:hypothetical protein